MDSITNKIQYNYTVAQGINTMSSVNELLNESGILKNINVNAGSIEMKTPDSSVEKDE